MEASVLPSVRYRVSLGTLSLQFNFNIQHSLYYDWLWDVGLIALHPHFTCGLSIRDSMATPQWNSRLSQLPHLIWKPLWRTCLHPRGPRVSPPRSLPKKTPGSSTGVRRHDRGSTSAHNCVEPSGNPGLPGCRFVRGVPIGDAKTFVGFVNAVLGRVPNGCPVDEDRLLRLDTRSTPRQAHWSQRGLRK